MAVSIKAGRKTLDLKSNKKVTYLYATHSRMHSRITTLMHIDINIYMSTFCIEIELEVVAPGASGKYN